MKVKCNHKGLDSRSLHEVQLKLASFEDDILPHLPSKEAILARAKQRQLKRKALNGAILSVLGLCIGIYWYNPVYEQFDAQTVKGQQEVFKLADGSKIHLNTDTNIRVFQRLRSREVVLYKGEASFHVAHSDYKFFQYFERQFKVIAGNMDIVDIGTVFNVLKHNATDTTVVVEEGEVAVKIRGYDGVMLHLKQGQSVSNYQHQLGQVLKVEVPEITAWQSGEMILNQMPLLEAIENFQRYADFEVEIQDPDLNHLQVTGQFKSKNYQQFMQVLPIATTLNVEKISDNKWIIKKN
jgi:transmembrane sensor